MLHELGRHLYKVARHIGTRERSIVAVGEDAVERVAELVEQRFHLVHIQHGRLVDGRLAEVEHQRHDRNLVFTVTSVILLSEVGHPRARALALTREEVHIDDGNDLAPIIHFKSLHIRMIYRQIAILLEGDPIEVVADIEKTLHGSVQGKIRTDGLIVEVVFLFSHLLTIIAPVKSFQLGARMILAQHLLVVCGLCLGFRKSRIPHLAQEFVHCIGRLGHTVVQKVCSVGVEAQQLGAFQTEVGNLVDDGGIVKLATQTATGIGSPDLLAKLAVLTVHQEGLPSGDVQGEDVLAGRSLVLFASFQGIIQLIFRKAFEFFHITDHEFISVGGIEHIVAELQGQLGQLLVDITEAFLLVGGHVGTTAHEAFIDNL